MKLLLVEDNDALREQMKWALNERFEVLEAFDSLSCLRRFEKDKPSLVCLDLGLDNVPDKGIELIDSLLTRDRLAKIIVITAQTDEALGKTAIAKGAFDYLIKPVDMEELEGVLNRARRLLGFEEEAPVDAEPMASTAELAMLGQCEAMQKIFAMIRRLATTDVSVLITGESGTGKELCARAIHYHSTRRDQPFVPINCGAIPETLLESELFGYMKGAFTGALSDKKGLIAAADKGTLFLDEIGDMPRHLQVKLLRFIEERSYQRLGDVESVHGDVRIVAATNKKDFAQEQGTSMRSDLYYRLSEFEIHLPPLRERGDDILLLAQGIVERHRQRFSLPKLALSTRAQNMLKHYSWPGNVRELENKLSRAAITCTNQIIEPDDLEFSVSSMGRLTLKEARDMFEREYVIAALKKAGNVISATAESLGISRPTLYDLMKKHGISIKTESTLEA